MTDQASIDNIRKAASGVVFVVAIVGAVLFLKLFSIADLAEPLQVMVLLATAILFGTVGFGLVALDAYCRAWILQAAESRER